jgi:putative Holliday junction resolvase
MANGNIITIEELARLHKHGERLFGLDLGTKTIGIAVSDGMLSIASSLLTIQRTKFTKDVVRMVELSEKNRVCGLVMGLPLNMDGSEGPRAQATRAFARNLGNLTSLPVVFWDERLSTVAAERAMIEADMSRKKRAEKIDAAAAAFILQGALDRIANLRN